MHRFALRRLARMFVQDFNLAILEYLVETLGARMPSGAASISADSESMRALREEAERIKLDLNDEVHRRDWNPPPPP